MSETRGIPGEFLPEQETIELKKERLKPLFEKSLDVWRNPDRPLREGALTVVQRLGSGEEHDISNLIAMTVEDDAVEFGMIDDGGEIGDSAYISWDTIVDAKEGGE
jgi:hypothetical protein